MAPLKTEPEKSGVMNIKWRQREREGGDSVRCNRNKAASFGFTDTAPRGSHELSSLRIRINYLNPSLQTKQAICMCSFPSM
jgi:hypothetical protein